MSGGDEVKHVVCSSGRIAEHGVRIGRAKRRVIDRIGTGV